MLSVKKAITKLKSRWNINSHSQFILVLLTFSVTGTTTLYARKLIFQWIGITAETDIWIKIPLYILIIFPVYQLLFLLIGALFGQFQFAWEFEKKMFSRFTRRR
jgi:hypothetical protein